PAKPHTTRSSKTRFKFELLRASGAARKNVLEKRSPENSATMKLFSRNLFKECRGRIFGISLPTSDEAVIITSVENCCTACKTLISLVPTHYPLLRLRLSYL